MSFTSLILLQFHGYTATDQLAAARFYDLNFVAANFA